MESLLTSTIGPILKVPMTSSLDTKVRRGISAKGICIAWTTLSHSFKVSKEPSEVLKTIAQIIVGTIAQLLVINALNHFFILSLRKPSVINCPAYVPVMVLLCPAANKPIPHI